MEAASFKFKLGDIVQLKSGGCTMTVVDVGREEFPPHRLLAYCSWHDCGDCPQDGEYPEEALKPADFHV